ncbi:MAG: Na+/H+ antiporter NhaC family protein [Eubacteriales bacterium]
MEPIQVGFLSVLPPIIAIGLALLTKEVISSLIIGILSGTLIYAAYTSTGIIGIITNTFSTAMQLMTAKLGDNAAIILFLGFLGILVMVVTKAGGSRAYGEWASRKIKTRAGAQLATSALGALIFIDDYFNCLTVGTVMRPVTDKNRISHAKLAYLIDATAAPICIIAPISSWAASVISYMEGTGLDGMSAFIQSIPYNLYAVFTFLMIILLSSTSLDFGPMARFERNAQLHGDLDSNTSVQAEEDELSTVKVSDKGKVIDLVLPILVLIVLSILSMLYVGGYFQGGMTLAEGFGNTDAGPALALASFGTLIFTFLWLVPRKVLSFGDFMSSIGPGVKSMVGAYLILTLAWTISGVCRDLLSTGEYVGELVRTSNMPVMLIPAIIFLVAAGLSFSMGTSWGTFGILIPIIASVCQKVAPDLTIIALSATLAGSVFGDHCSPISDTTILSSTGAKCHHLDHVSTQIPYALVVAIASLAGYLVAGVTENLIATLLTSLVVLVAIIVVLHRKFVKQNPEEN